MYLIANRRGTSGQNNLTYLSRNRLYRDYRGRIEALYGALDSREEESREFESLSGSEHFEA